MTTAYASMNVAGPQARQLIERVAEEVDLSNSAFPYMPYGLGGSPASTGAFSGESASPASSATNYMSPLATACMYGRRCWTAAPTSERRRSVSKPSAFSGWRRVISSLARTPTG